MMNSEQTLMFKEAKSAGKAVRRCFAENRELFEDIGLQIRKLNPKFIVTNARGSSDHAGVFGKYAFSNYMGTIVASGAPSLTSVYNRQMDASSSLVLSISQSGESPDIVAFADALSKSGGLTISIINQDKSALSRVSEYTIPMYAGPEKSVAASKSFVTTLAIILAIVSHWDENHSLKAELDLLPDLLDEAWSLEWEQLIEGTKGINNLFTIGRGAGLGIANEAALKFKETCQIHAESFSAAECIHGPMALLGPNFPILAFCPEDPGRESIFEVASRGLAAGATVYLAGADVKGTVNLPTPRAPTSLQPLLMLQSFYKAVSEIAVERGLNPDCPPTLQKVTRTV